MARYKDMRAVREANRDAGHFWFSPESLDFFNTIIESDLWHGQYFVTSETPEADTPRRYTVRFVKSNGHIVTLGNRREHETLQAASEAIHDHYLAHSVNGEVPDSFFE